MFEREWVVQHVHVGALPIVEQRTLLLTVFPWHRQTRTVAQRQQRPAGDRRPTEEGPLRAAVVLLYIDTLQPFDFCRRVSRWTCPTDGVLTPDGLLRTAVAFVERRYESGSNGASLERAPYIGYGRSTRSPTDSIQTSS